MGWSISGIRDTIGKSIDNATKNAVQTLQSLPDSILGNSEVSSVIENVKNIPMNKITTGSGNEVSCFSWLHSKDDLSASVNETRNLDGEIFFADNSDNTYVNLKNDVKNAEFTAPNIEMDGNNKLVKDMTSSNLGFKAKDFSCDAFTGPEQESDINKYIDQLDSKYSGIKEIYNEAKVKGQELLTSVEPQLEQAGIRNAITTDSGNKVSCFFWEHSKDDLPKLVEESKNPDGEIIFKDNAPNTKVDFNSNIKSAEFTAQNIEMDGNGNKFETIKSDELGFKAKDFSCEEFTGPVEKSLLEKLAENAKVTFENAQENYNKTKFAYDAANNVNQFLHN